MASETVVAFDRRPDGGRYTWQFHSRHYELGVGGLVRPDVYLNWLQEVGILASIHGGWPLSRYQERGAFWWVRRFSMEWHVRVGYREALEATTWISQFRRIRCHREYEVRRTEDGRLVFAAQAEWAFVDVHTARPTPIPDDMIRAFPPDDRTASRPFEWPVSIPRPSSPAVTSRQVNSQELDTMGHVNNATYLAWLWDNLTVAADSAEIQPLRFEIEYLQQVRRGQALVVSAWPSGAGLDGPVWRHEIHDTAGLLLARAATEVSF